MERFDKILILEQGGLVGFTTFFLTIGKTFQGYFLTLRFYKRGKNPEGILLLPFICFFTGLFAGLVFVMAVDRNVVALYRHLSWSY